MTGAVVEQNIGVTFGEPVPEGEPATDPPTALPPRLRSLVRSLAYSLIADEDKDEGESPAPGADPEAKVRALVVAAAGVLDDRVMDTFVRRVLELRNEEAAEIRSKRLTRRDRRTIRLDGDGGVPDRRTQVRHVHFPPV